MSEALVERLYAEIGKLRRHGGILAEEAERVVLAGRDEGRTLINLERALDRFRDAAGWIPQKYEP